APAVERHSRQHLEPLAHGRWRRHPHVDRAAHSGCAHVTGLLHESRPGARGGDGGDPEAAMRREGLSPLEGEGAAQNLWRLRSCALIATITVPSLDHFEIEPGERPSYVPNRSHSAEARSSSMCCFSYTSSWLPQLTVM